MASRALMQSVTLLCLVSVSYTPRHISFAYIYKFRPDARIFFYLLLLSQTEKVGSGRIWCVRALAMFIPSFFFLILYLRSMPCSRLHGIYVVHSMLSHGGWGSFLHATCRPVMMARTDLSVTSLSCSMRESE